MLSFHWFTRPTVSRALVVWIFQYFFPAGYIVMPSLYEWAIKNCFQPIHLKHWFIQEH